MSWISDRVDYFLSPWRDLLDVRADVVRHELALQTMENRMSATESALAELDAATNEVASELDALEAQVASFDSDTAAKISAAANRLRGLAVDPENPVPPADSDPAPVEPVADPAQPVETQPDDAA